jgi:hypothetical protein
MEKASGRTRCGLTISFDYYIRSARRTVGIILGSGLPKSGRRLILLPLSAHGDRPESQPLQAGQGTRD